MSRFQKIVDSDGTEKFAKIEDSKEYFKAIEEFAVQRKLKMSQALDDYRLGKSPLEPGFWHRVDQALVKLLFENPTPDDPDILFLRENYFHIFASYLVEVKKETVFGQNVLLSNFEDRKRLASIASKTLDDAFLSSQQSSNRVSIYKKYRKHLPDSLEDHSIRVIMQLTYLKDLDAMLQKIGSQEESIRILYILDIYRRYYEMIFPILNLLRIAILISKGETKITLNASAEEIISVLNENECSEFVNAFNPQIRHCESHLATRIREGKRVVLLTERKGLRRVPIQEFSYEEIVDHLNRLRVVFPALYFAFSNFDGFLKILLMKSMEYQLLLISKTTA